MVMTEAGLIVAAIVALLCRINAMKSGQTQNVVFAQHFALVVALFVSLFVQIEYAKTCIMFGVVAFLGMGAHRWKHGAPAGTLNKRAPIPLTRVQLQSVYGGQSDVHAIRQK